MPCHPGEFPNLFCLFAGLCASRAGVELNVICERSIPDREAIWILILLCDCGALLFPRCCEGTQSLRMLECTGTSAGRCRPCAGEIGVGESLAHGPAAKPCMQEARVKAVA